MPFLAAALLLALGMQTAASPAAGTTPTTKPVAGTRFTLDTPVEAIVADPKAKAVLEADMPGVSTHPSYEMFKSMSLKQLQSYAPDKLTDAVLAKTATDLAAIK